MLVEELLEIGLAKVSDAILQGVVEVEHRIVRVAVAVQIAVLAGLQSRKDDKIPVDDRPDEHRDAEIPHLSGRCVEDNGNRIVRVPVSVQIREPLSAL